MSNSTPLLERKLTPREIAESYGVNVSKVLGWIHYLPAGAIFGEIPSGLMERREVVIWQTCHRPGNIDFTCFINHGSVPYIHHRIVGSESVGIRKW